MGASESKLVFKQGIFRLSEEQNIPATDNYWTGMSLYCYTLALFECARRLQALRPRSVKADMAYQASGNCLSQSKMSSACSHLPTYGGRATPA